MYNHIYGHVYMHVEPFVQTCVKWGCKAGIHVCKCVDLHMLRLKNMCLVQLVNIHVHRQAQHRGGEAAQPGGYQDPGTGQGTGFIEVSSSLGYGCIDDPPPVRARMHTRTDTHTPAPSLGPLP